MPASIRKIIVQTDETHIEMGEKVSPPTRRAVACAVIENPFAGRYEKDLSLLTEIGVELGDLLESGAFFGAIDRVRRLMFLEKLLYEIDDALASLED